MKQSDYCMDNIIHQKSTSNIKIFDNNKESKFGQNSPNFPTLGKKHLSVRKKNSLGKLGKKFANYLSKKKDDRIDLNDASKALNIKKRRIYDITNVLEGKQLI